MWRWIIRGIAVAVGLVVLSACTPPPTGQTYFVSTVLDSVDINPGDGFCLDSSGECSLRAAVMEANTDTLFTRIELPAGLGQVYNLTIPGLAEDGGATGDIDIHERVFIVSTGGPPAEVNANGLDRVFEVHGGQFHLLRGLRLTGGSAANGGGVLARTGIVGFEDSHITGNTASNQGGGALSTDDAALWIEDSTFEGNTAMFGGAIYSDSTGLTRLFQTTVTENVVQSFLLPGQVMVEGTLQIVSSTLVSDPATVDIIGGQGSSTTISASIIGRCGDLATPPSIISDGYNVAGPTCPTNGTGDQSAEPELLPLGNYLGAFPILPPTPRSLSLDSIPVGVAGCSGTGADTRFIPRPQSGSCDAGAVELFPTERWGADCPNGVPNPLGPNLDLYGCDLSGMNVSGLDLSNADLRYADMSGVNANSANFSGADFTRAQLAGADFLFADLTNATLTNADANNTNLAFTNLAGVRSGGLTGFQGYNTGYQNISGFIVGPAVDLSGETLPFDFTDLNLATANLANTNFQGATVIRTDFVGANLTGANLTLINCGACDFTGATMVNTTLTNMAFIGGTLLNADFTGANATDVLTWFFVQCPDGTGSGSHGDTCIGHL